MSESFGLLLGSLICIGIVALVVVGVVVLLFINRSRSQAKTAVPPNWPTITGRVTAARVEESVRTRPDDDVFFYPSVEFEYTVAGQVYTGKQAVGKSFNLESKANQTVAQYPPGTEVVVYYNPERPHESRLLLK